MSANRIGHLRAAGRHARRALRSAGPSGRDRAALQLGRIGDGQQVVGHHERHTEDGLGVGLVPTGEHPSGVGGLHLAGGQDPLDAFLVDERGPVEATQLVVEDTPEPQAQRRLPGRERPVERERGALGLVVECDLRHDRPATGASVDGELGSRLVDLDLGRVEHHLARLGQHLDGNGLVSGKGGGLEVGLEGQVVAAGQDGAWEPMAVGRRVGQVGLGRRDLLGHGMPRYPPAATPDIGSRASTSSRSARVR